MTWQRRDQTEDRGSGAQLIEAFDVSDRRRSLEPGDVLARQGDEADEVFVVVEVGPIVERGYLAGVSAVDGWLEGE